MTSRPKKKADPQPHPRTDPAPSETSAPGHDKGRPPEPVHGERWQDQAPETD